MAISRSDPKDKETEHPAAGILQLLPFLPDDILFGIFLFLAAANPRDASNLAKLFSKEKYHHFFKPKLDLLKLAHFLVVKPNIAEVVKMVKTNPILLQTVIPQITVNNTLIVGYKPFQLAHGSWNGEMCLALKTLMIDILGSEAAARAEIEKQVAEKFPQDKENDDQIKNKLAGMLNTVIKAITNEQFNLGQYDEDRWILNSATLAAIDAFSNDLDALQPKVIEKGMHDRLNTIQEILDEYVRAAAMQWNYDYKQCALFEDGVLSQALVRIKSINVAEDLSQGLHYLLNNKEERRASLFLRNTHNNFYSCLRDSSSDFVLTSSCVNIVFGLAGGAGPDEGFVAGVFNAYVEQKLQICRTYAPIPKSDEVDAQLSKNMKMG